MSNKLLFLLVSYCLLMSDIIVNLISSLGRIFTEIGLLSTGNDLFFLFGQFGDSTLYVITFLLKVVVSVAVIYEMIAWFIQLYRPSQHDQQ